MNIYSFILQPVYAISDRFLNDNLVSGAAEVWLLLEAPTTVNRFWRDGLMVEQWTAVTDKTVIYSGRVH